RNQAKETICRKTCMPDIGPHVQLAECIEKRQRGRQASANPAQPKWCNGNVGYSLAQIQLQFLRDLRAHLVRRKRPMSKEQIRPSLLDAPRSAGHGNGAVRGLKQKRMHVSAI